MSVDVLYLARFFTASKRQHADDLLEMGRRGEVLALESFWANVEVSRILEEFPKVKIFLDSGAYTMETQQVQDVQKYLDDYIDYILKHEDRWFGYVSLDDIQDVEVSWRNQKYMEGRGVNPLPVYHAGEDFKWFEKCANEYDYMGLGGVARGMSATGFRTLLDKIFNYIDRRNLSTKIHGFGMTSYKYLVRYPWYSVDSTTWLKQAGFGRIMLPRIDSRTGEFDYMCTPYVVSVSDISMVKTNTDHNHYSLITPEAVEKIHEYFAMIGVDPEKLKTEQAERLKANVMYYDRLMKEVGMHAPFKLHGIGESQPPVF